MNRIILYILPNLVWVRVSEWVTGLGVRFLVYLKLSRILGFIICRESGISGSTYAMKLKLTPGMALDKRNWLITSSAMSLDSCLFCRPKVILLASAKNGWWRLNQLLWWRRLPRGSFNITACLEPVKQDDHYFHPEILVCKFHLGSRKACLRMRRRLCHQIFLWQNVPKQIKFTETKFHVP